MNYINYLKHILFTPETYLRRFDIDLVYVGEQSKRVALVALPFIGLYRPIAPVLSTAMESCRIVTHLNKAMELEREENKNWTAISKELGHAGLATLSLATTAFSFSGALFITTGFDLVQGIKTASHHFIEGNDKAREETLQVLASGCYLAFIATGALEAILLSTLLQAVICLYQAKNNSESKLEIAAKIAMAGIHLRQANYYRQLIVRRNALFTMQKYQALVTRALKGKAVRHLIQSPLNDLSGQIEERRVILANQDKEYDFGSHFHGLGKGLIKGANLTFRQVVVNGQEMTELEFKVNHAFRDKLEQSFKDLSKINQKEMKEILKFTGSHVEGISTQTIEKDDFWWNDLDKTHEIALKGLGTITIGASPDAPNLYDRVTIQMDAQKTLYDLHEMMAFTDLDAALCLSTKDDLDRLKLGHLFRTFFPKEATPFEITEDFFSLPTEQLKKQMIQKAPEMQQVFDTYFDKMSEAEILPGRVRYRITGLKEEIHALGGRALTAAITGAYWDDEELYARIASMLSMGMISSEFKDIYHLNSAHGLGGDYFAGSADSIYTQMLTERNIQERLDLRNLYFSRARLLISLDALETGSYQYYTDSYGNRLRKSSWFWWDDYSTRPNILEFTKQLQSDKPNIPFWGWGGDPTYNRHEVMLKERLDPSFFTGIILDSEQTKQDLLNYLRAQNLVQKDASGQETILHIAVNKFLRVGTVVTEDLIS